MIYCSTLALGRVKSENWDCGLVAPHPAVKIDFGPPTMILIAVVVNLHNRGATWHRDELLSELIIESFAHLIKFVLWISGSNSSVNILKTPTTFAKSLQAR